MQDISRRAVLAALGAVVAAPVAAQLAPVASEPAVIAVRFAASGREGGWIDMPYSSSLMGQIAHAVTGWEQNGYPIYPTCVRILGRVEWEVTSDMIKAIEQYVEDNPL